MTKEKGGRDNIYIVIFIEQYYQKNMKNIIVVGASRSGKSTFIKKVLKKYPNYNLISEEIVASAYFDVMQEAACASAKDGLGEANISWNFIDLMVEKIFECSCSYEPKLNFILESFDYPLEKLKELEKEGNVVLVFGYPKLTVEEVIRRVKKYETEDDWTYPLPNAILNRLMKKTIQQSRYYKKECKSLNLKFIDTSYDRDKVFNDLLDWFSKNIE